MGPCRTRISDACRPSVKLSVHDRGAVEAQRHKWIESEKAGRDLGEWAIRCWVRQHWNGFLRAKWLEHLEGRTFWIELDHDDFGLLQRAFQDSRLIERDPPTAEVGSGKSRHPQLGDRPEPGDGRSPRDSRIARHQ